MEAREQIKIINDFAYKLVEDRKQDPHLHTRKDLLSKYMVCHSIQFTLAAVTNRMTFACKTMEDQQWSDSYLRDLIMNFSIAGRDTTAQTLSWYFLTTTLTLLLNC